MTEFVDNFFLSNRSEKMLKSPRAQTNKKIIEPKKIVALYLGKIIESRVQKQLSYGLGKILIEGIPTISLSQKNMMN